ncbi:MAG: DUF134 domain-containing protein [Candidatus Absconditabacterales bacterium]|nr:DUF134 domain-containing protein [Candidatus Absconditabacterales bacterium]
MPRGRKKNPRYVNFDPMTMICQCFGPLKLSHEELQHRPHIIMTKDELQTIVDKDINGMTMDEGAQCMGISKTVYAGTYALARKKIARSLIEGCVLSIECPDTPLAPPVIT